MTASTISALPLSEMGRCTGRFYLDERRPLFAMRFYCDASEGQDDNSARWLTLAGLMASDQFWGDFQTRWEVVLKDRYPRAPYLHMNPLVMREDPFERVVGWTDEKVSQLVLDAINFLSSINKRAFRAFVISIDVTAHQRLLAEGLPLGGDPVDIITSLCLDSAIKWYCAEHPDNIERLYVFFDQNEPHIKTLRDKWLQRRAAPGQVTVDPMVDLIANILPLDMRDNPPIQAADLFAWARTRGLSNKERMFRYLADVAARIIPNGSLLIDESLMRTLAKDHGWPG